VPIRTGARRAELSIRKCAW